VLEKIKGVLSRKPKEDPIGALRQELNSLREMREIMPVLIEELRETGALKQELNLLKEKLQNVVAERDELLAKQAQPTELKTPAPISTSEGNSIAAASLDEAALTARAQRVYKNLVVKVVDNQLHVLSNRHLTEPEWRQLRATVWMELLNVV